MLKAECPPSGINSVQCSSIQRLSYFAVCADRVLRKLNERPVWADLNAAENDQNWVV